MTFGSDEGGSSEDSDEQESTGESEDGSGEDQSAEQPGETPTVSDEEGAPPEDAETAETIDSGKKTEFDDTIHIVQRKPVLEKNRFELTPRFGTSINDSVYRSFKVGTNANYHVAERAYVGGVFEWFNFGDALGGTTSVFDQSVEETQSAPDAPFMNWMAAVEGGFVPIYGKFALFNLAIVYYELGASLGVSYQDVDSLGSGAGQMTFGGTGSINARIFLNDWMAIGLELRDAMFPVTMSSGGGDPVSTLGNIVTFSAGASFYFPTTFTYDEAGSE